MRIKWYGQSLFEIITKPQQNSEVRIVIDPFDKSLGLSVPKLEADILLVTHHHHDHCNIEAVAGTPFLIDGPGEYEVKGVYIKGIPAFHDNVFGKERGRVTMFTIDSEDIKICHLSDIGQNELTEKQIEEIGEVNILMIPTGGVYTIGPKEASRIINQLEPQVVIPMHYQIPKLKLKLEGIDKFLKVMGIKELEQINKLLIKKKDLLGEKTRVVILKHK
ncbi:MBL fold metallo-hydrolase [bacterium]|nr:MBL fold metallo-hydrolase [bacterium]